jgi:hypothetical protein
MRAAPSVEHDCHRNEVSLSRWASIMVVTYQSSEAQPELLGHTPCGTHRSTQQIAMNITPTFQSSLFETSYTPSCTVANPCSELDVSRNLFTCLDPCRQTSHLEVTLIQPRSTKTRTLDLLCKIQASNPRLRSELLTMPAKRLPRQLANLHSIPTN